MEKQTWGEAIRKYYAKSFLDDIKYFLGKYRSFGKALDLKKAKLLIDGELARTGKL
jgi:hypothetical protein